MLRQRKKNYSLGGRRGTVLKIEVITGGFVRHQSGYLDSQMLWQLVWCFYNRWSGKYLSHLEARCQSEQGRGHYQLSPWEGGHPPSFCYLPHVQFGDQEDFTWSSSSQQGDHGKWTMNRDSRGGVEVWDDARYNPQVQLQQKIIWKVPSDYEGGILSAHATNLVGSAQCWYLWPDL